MTQFKRQTKEFEEAAQRIMTSESLKAVMSNNAFLLEHQYREQTDGYRVLKVTIQLMRQWRAEMKRLMRERAKVEKDVEQEEPSLA